MKSGGGTHAHMGAVTTSVTARGAMRASVMPVMVPGAGESGGGDRAARRHGVERGGGAR